MSKTVKWIGKGFKGNPEIVYKEIQSIGDSYTPQDILEYAREHEDSELNKCFDWDDTTAAEKWRIFTARQICCSLKVIVIHEDKEPVSYRIIQHDHEEKAYKPVTLTVRNDDEYSRLLKQAKAELAAFRKRYEKIVELEPIIDEIERVLAE